MNGPVPLGSIFIYRPDKRIEIWRFVLYMCVHPGYVYTVTLCMKSLPAGGVPFFRLVTRIRENCFQVSSSYCVFDIFCVPLSTAKLKKTRKRKQVGLVMPPFPGIIFKTILLGLIAFSVMPCLRRFLYQTINYSVLFPKYVYLFIIPTSVLNFEIDGNYS